MRTKRDDPLYHPKYEGASTEELIKLARRVGGVEQQKIQFELAHRLAAKRG